MGKKQRKDQRPCRQNRWSTISWTCPICSITMELSGYDKAHGARAQHVLPKVAPPIGDKIREGRKNNPVAIGASSTSITQRAFQRARMLAEDHNHDLRHCNTNGLFPFFQKTWFCTKCVCDSLLVALWLRYHATQEVHVFQEKSQMVEQPSQP